MGRHRRYISFICHGVRILFQEVDDCRRHSRYCIYNHSFRNDVSRLCSRKRTWLLTYKQHIFRGMLSMSSTAIVFKAFDDMGLRGQKIYRSCIGCFSCRRFSSRCSDGLAFDFSSQPASGRNGNVEKHSKVRSISYILVITRNLSYSKFSKKRSNRFLTTKPY